MPKSLAQDTKIKQASRKMQFFRMVSAVGNKNLHHQKPKRMFCQLWTKNCSVFKLKQ